MTHPRAFRWSRLCSDANKINLLIIARTTRVIQCRNCSTQIWSKCPTLPTTSGKISSIALTTSTWQPFSIRPHSGSRSQSSRTWSWRQRTSSKIYAMSFRTLHTTITACPSSTTLLIPAPWSPLFIITTMAVSRLMAVMTCCQLYPRSRTFFSIKRPPQRKLTRPFSIASRSIRISCTKRCKRKKYKTTQMISTT